VSQTHDEVRALRVMVEVLRAEPPPELPWDAIEQRLFSRLDAQPALGLLGGSSERARHSHRGSPFLRVLGFAAAAAALALSAGSLAGSGQMPAATAPPLHRVDASAVAFAPGSTRVHDLSALRAGDVVEAGDTPVRFGQAGLATWSLAPGSVAHVHTTGVGHTVALERGAIRAEVTPRDPSEGLVEAFAVEVEGTRIAVHGTAFSVRIEGGQAIVDVEHGAVAVGPVGNAGATTGHLLVGPSRASFSLDGGRSARLLNRASGALVASDLEDTPTEPSVAAAAVGALLPPAPVAIADAPAGHDADRPTAAQAPRPLAARAPVDAKVAAHAAAAPPAAPDVPSEPPPLSVATVQSRVDRCFRQHYKPEPSSSGSSVTVSSTLNIKVKPDGSVMSMSFSPTLVPEMLNCASSILSGRFPEGTGTVVIPFSFQR
jgi:FecR protein